MPSTSSSVTSRGAVGADHLAVLHHRQPVAQPEHVGHVVADQEDAHAFGLELPDQLADHARFFRPERGAGLVHDQDAGVEVERARDRHRLALPARQAPHRHADVLEVLVQAREHLARLGVHAQVVERAPRRQQLAAEEQVGHRVQVVGQRQRLVDGLDAQRLRIGRRADVHLLAADQDLAAVDRVRARQHLHQRGLAGAVVAEQRRRLRRGTG